MTPTAQVIVFPVESPAERAAQSALVAAADLRHAVWHAESPEALRALRQTLQELMQRLNATDCDALTLIEHWRDER